MRVPALLFVVAFTVRALSGSVFPDPAFPDPLYYVNVARQVAAGHGLVVDYIWSFVEVGGVLPTVGVLPVASNAHWMPLASLVQVPFIWLLGPTSLASALPFWIAGAAVAPLTWWIGRDAGLARWQAVAAAALVIVPGGLLLYMGQPDNFALFMLAGALALWLCARGLRGDRRSFAVGGVAVGLATLSRTDGILLGVPFAFAAIGEALRRPAARRIGLAAAVLCAAGFLVVVAPWLLRQLTEFGSVSPSASSGRILWAVDHDQIFSVTSETTPASFLAQGVDRLLAGRLGGLVAALVIFAVMPMLAILVPFLVIGAWARRRDVAFAPWLTYGACLLVASGLLFAVYVTHGFFIHSAVALLPHAYVLSVAGIGVAVAWLARRRHHWDLPRASRIITSLVVIVVMVASVMASTTTLRDWTREAEQRQPLLAGLAGQARPGDRVMSPDPGAYRYHGGWQGVVTPDDPLATVEEALARYDIRWLALERDHTVRALAPLLKGEQRPDWLSEPIVRVPSADPGDAVPSAALYAVCLEPEDARCRS